MGTFTGANVYNVVDYGAVGDGSTDDTTAFQNAITAACAGNGIDFGPLSANMRL